MTLSTCLHGKTINKIKKIKKCTTRKNRKVNWNKNNGKHGQKRKKYIKKVLNHKKLKEFHLNECYHIDTFARLRQKYFLLRITSAL